jgi:uncharacterized protein YxeA
MKKVIVVLTLVLFMGTLVAPAMQVFSNSNVVVFSDDENPKDKKQDKTTTADKKADTKKDAKCDAKKAEKKDCATKCSGEKKPGCCSEEKKKEDKK